MLARRLPVIVEILDSAFYVYGPRLTSRITKTASIHNLLKQHKAKELLAMLSALHPDWHTFILHIYDPKVRELPEEQQHEIRLRKRRCIEAFPENRLRKYILSKELFVGWKGNKPTKEWRRHGLAEILENMFTLRDGQRENINLFVEHLFHGRLWSLSRGETDSQPGKTYVDCPWKGRGDNPPRKDVRAWMKIVMPFLEAQTGGDMKQRGDPMRLAVFERLLSTRKGRHEPGDLNNEFHPVALGSRTLAWNYLRGELADAWTRMTKRAIKLKSGKPA